MVCQFIQKWQCTHILKTQNRCCMMSGKTFFSLQYFIGKAAWLRTSATVSTSSADDTTEKALSGITVTQCAMNKAFQFHTYFIMDSLNFF